MRSALVIVGILAVATPAWAGDDLTTLETQLNHDTAALSTSDCASACKALASIRRAADRICQLEPGVRCDAARAKADDATRRVREACPECAVAALPAPEQPQERAATPPQDAAAPAAEAPRGGCRSCATTPERPLDGGDFAVFALAVLAVMKRQGNRAPKARGDCRAGARGRSPRNLKSRL